VDRLGGIVNKVSDNFKSLNIFRGKHLKIYYKWKTDIAKEEKED